MSTQQESAEQPAPSEQPAEDDLDRRQEELSAKVDQHLALLRGEGKTQ
ncbi:hypothetical protein OIU91_19890 [Streptomyces sp. NBC_01456]|nr:hypothetical protein [Streptomyces sp. NBC_01456]